MATETTATQPSGRNVLEDLDSRIPTRFYWYLAVLACIGGFLFGYDTSNIGSALGFIPYHLSSFATGYLVAGASLGAAAGALIAGREEMRLRKSGFHDFSPPRELIDRVCYARAVSFFP